MFFGLCGLIAEELAHELAEFLSRRYPKVYSVTRHPRTKPNGSVAGNGWYDEGRIKDITILPLGVTYNLDEEEPMKVAGLLYVSPDPASGKCSVSTKIRVSMQDSGRYGHYD